MLLVVLLQPVHNHLALPLVCDQLCFSQFAFPLMNLLLSSTNPGSVLPVLSQLLREVFMAYLLFGTYCTMALCTAFSFSPLAVWRPLALWTTVLGNLGWASFLFLTHILTQPLALILNSLMMDFFCLLFFTTKLKPSGFPAVPELCPKCCVGAGLGGHLPLAIPRPFLEE